MVTEDIFKNIYEGKTVLVTGDTGFKGSWLAIWLLKLGANVIGYGLKPKTEKDNYIICDLENRINHIQGDIRDYQTLLQTFTKFKPEIILHLAAQSLVLPSYQDPLYTFGTNIMGTVNLFEAVRNTPSVKVAINITSDKCYENREWVYGYREVDPIGGKDPYSASKGASEIITSSYLSSFFKTDDRPAVASVRAGNVVGGGDWADYRIFPDCMRAFLQDQPIIIRNPGAVRPWQHVLEPLCGYLTLGSFLYRYGKDYSGPWNFGPLSKNMVSVKQLVEDIRRQWGGGTYRVADEEENKLEANFLHLDVSKAVNRLQWLPVLDIKQTVRFTIEEYRIDGYSPEDVFDQRMDHINQYIELRHKIYE